MLSTSAQQLKDIGTSMGLEGTDLLNFVREQQKLEREERDKKKERQREKERQGKEKNEKEEQTRKERKY